VKELAIYLYVSVKEYIVVQTAGSLGLFSINKLPILRCLWVGPAAPTPQSTGFLKPSSCLVDE
jgi:hypothetical protein